MKLLRGVFKLESVPIFSCEPPLGQLFQDNNRVLAATARLDNRDRLADELKLSLPDRAGLADSTLVSLAYRLWGDECVNRLKGDWSFVAWNGERRSLFVARDHFGNTGLFYYHQASIFACASTLRELFVLGVVPAELDEDRFLRHLAFLPCTPSHTFWRNIRSLPPGHSLTVSGSSLNVRRYWYPAQTSIIKFGSEIEYLDGFIDAFEEAVKTRLLSIGGLGSTLSSGLDSTSVTALAARIAKSRGETLTAFTSVPVFPSGIDQTTWLYDEWPLAQATAIHYSNIKHVRVDAHDVSPLAGIRKVISILGEPPNSVGNMYWIIAMLESARNNGIGVLLTGQMGNAGISWHGGRERVLHQLSSGACVAAWRSMSNWSQWHNRSLWHGVRHHLLSPLARRIIRVRNRPLNYALRRFPSKAYVIPETRWQWTPVKPSSERVALLVQNSFVGGFWHTVSNAYGVEVLDPTADIRLLEYCMNIPERLFTAEGGERMLLRRGMADLLPPEVLKNSLRGRQAADLPERLLAHDAEMQDTLEQMNSPLINEFMDWQQVRNAWQRLAKAPASRNRLSESAMLLHNVTAAMFLEEMDNARHGV